MIEDPAIQTIRVILFVAVLFGVTKSLIPSRGLKNKSLYFEFCQLRRDIMRLVIDDKVDIKSFPFEFFIRFLSDVIHYSDDYNFGARYFLRAIKRDSADLAHKKFVEKLNREVKTQSTEFQDLFDRFFRVMTIAFMKNPLVWMVINVSFLYRIFSSWRPKSRYTYAAGAVITVRSEWAVRSELAASPA